MGLPICEIYILHQPHQNPNPEPQTSATEDLQNATNDLQNLLQGDVLSQPLSPWKSPSTRVRSILWQGCDPTFTSYYDVRRQRSITELEAKHHVDVAMLPLPKPSNLPPSHKRPIRLAVFDMDSTLINQEVIDELAREIGAYDAVSAITERAMRGELDFAGSLRERVALLKGLPADIWDTIRGRITFAEGARAFCRELKRQGAKMAVLSGGFTPLAEWVKGELGLDVAHANWLEEEEEEVRADGVRVLSGRLVAGKKIVTAERKRELLVELAEQNGVKMDEVLCVGDGSNDLKMMGVVGEGGGVAIALKAKPKVQLEAPNKLNSRSMTDILYLLGYTEDEIKEIE